MNKFYFSLTLFFIIISANAQQSVARQWNEQLLDAIRLDFARPTIHARNLFHSSVLMYDAWAIFNDNAETVFLGKNFQGYNCMFLGIETPSNVTLARQEVLSFATYRLLNHRFANSPNNVEVLNNFNTFFISLGYDPNFTSVDYSNNNYAALGNYMAEQMIAFGLQDFSNEINNHVNQYYTISNDPLILDIYSDENNMANPNAWQPLSFEVFIDQNGIPSPVSTPAFLSPEWGQVLPFSLNNSDLEILNNGFDSYVYKNPGPPAYIQNSLNNGIDDPYKWHFALVAAWSSHLDPNNVTEIDISPASIGNLDSEDFPESFDEYKSFYNFFEGGDASQGHSINPFTGNPYTPQMVKRSDYARVLAEFWADGPDSETPPGHWFTILNYVSDHEHTIKKMEGLGDVLGNLEWDVKSYLALGGAMHDAAIATWGIKGYYNYVRPISAIRYMAGKGQSTDNSLPSFDPHGLPLIPGLIELIFEGDELAGSTNENVNKIKIKSWKGADFIANPETDVAGVGWILGTHWWSYQRNSFVTPPFAGYLSGHSTFSAAAAEVLTLITGDAFFPGGIGTFNIEQNEFLVFEEGPTESFTLQWATYRDASSQTSLSRIWGGIHPPIDDIRGRQIGAEIGVEAFTLSKTYFNELDDLSTIEFSKSLDVYPIPMNDYLTITYNNDFNSEVVFYNLLGQKVLKQTIHSNNRINTSILDQGIYFLNIKNENSSQLIVKKVIKN